VCISSDRGHARCLRCSTTLSQQLMSKNTCGKDSGGYTTATNLPPAIAEETGDLVALHYPACFSTQSLPLSSTRGITSPDDTCVLYSPWCEGLQYVERRRTPIVALNAALCEDEAEV
jgi:hypothetical protein